MCVLNGAIFYLNFQIMDDPLTVRSVNSLFFYLFQEGLLLFNKTFFWLCLYGIKSTLNWCYFFVAEIIAFDASHGLFSLHISYLETCVCCSWCRHCYCRIWFGNVLSQNASKRQQKEACCIRFTKKDSIQTHWQKGKFLRYTVLSWIIPEYLLAEWIFWPPVRDTISLGY